MIIISDTSPIRYLVLIDEIGLLPNLFQSVIIPPIVAAELQQSKTPPPVRSFMATAPNWLSIQAPSKIDPTLHADPGEREAILLAVECGVPLLIDDNRGRKAAADRHVHTIGTLAVLELAAEKRFIDLPTSFQKLRKSTNFRMDESILNAALARDSKRKLGGS